MNAKIFVVSLIVLVAGSLSFAGDQKPINGWVQHVSEEAITLEQAKAEYPYLSEVIGVYGEPDPMSLAFFPPKSAIYHGKNNVGGDSIHSNGQIGYFFPFDPYFFRFVLVFYEESTITVANGDKIFVEVEGIYYYPLNKIIATDTIVGGTGRFEGAEGSMTATWNNDSHDQQIVVFDGYITTIGGAKKPND